MFLFLNENKNMLFWRTFVFKKAIAFAARANVIIALFCLPLYLGLFHVYKLVSICVGTACGGPSKLLRHT